MSILRSRLTGAYVAIVVLTTFVIWFWQGKVGDSRDIRPATTSLDTPVNSTSIVSKSPASSALPVVENENVLPNLLSGSVQNTTELGQLTNSLIEADNAFRISAAQEIFESHPFSDVVADLRAEATPEEQALAARINGEFIRLGKDIPHTVDVACGKRACAYHLTNIRKSDIPKMETRMGALVFGTYAVAPYDESETDYGEIKVLTNTDIHVATVIADMPD